MLEAIYYGAQRVVLRTSEGSVEIWNVVQAWNVGQQEHYRWEIESDGHIVGDKHILTCATTVTVENRHISFVESGKTVTQDIAELVQAFEEVVLAFLPLGNKYAGEFVLEDAVACVGQLRPKYVVPIYHEEEARRHILPDAIVEFTRLIMLNQYAVPKVLRPGQAIIF